MASSGCWKSPARWRLSPSLLLLDEPAAGMNPQETEELGAFIQRIKKQFNLTILIIEHHMNLIMDISDRIYVVDFGRLIAQGTPDEIQNNRRGDRGLSGR